MLIDRLKKIYNGVVQNDFTISFSSIGIIIALLFIMDVGCPTRYLTGICCPGCGMTRAVLHLLRLDISGAIYYHPLVFTLPVIAILFILKKRLNIVLLNMILTLIVIAFISVYVVRLIDPNNDVIYADIRRGIAYKIFQKLIGENYVL